MWNESIQFWKSDLRNVKCEILRETWIPIFEKSAPALFVSMWRSYLTGGVGGEIRPGADRTRAAEPAGIFALKHKSKSIRHCWDVLKVVTCLQSSLWTSPLRQTQCSTRGQWPFRSASNTLMTIGKMSGEMAPFLRSCASFSLPPGGASAHMTSDTDQACLDVYVITLPKPVIGSVNKMSG